MDADATLVLSVGMVTYNAFDGVYFTAQALRLYQDLVDTELLVVDNYGCVHTQRFIETLQFPTGIPVSS